MKKNLIFIFPLIFLFLSIFNIPVCFPSVLLNNHYFVPYQNYIDAEYYFKILLKYKNYTLFDGKEKLNLNIKNIRNSIELKQNIDEMEFGDSINFYDLIEFVFDYINWFEKPVIIIPFYPSVGEMAYLKELNNGIPLKILIEKQDKISIISAINSKISVDERKLVLNILFNNEISKFSDITLFKVLNNKKIILDKKKSEEILSNSNIFEYKYKFKDEKTISFELLLGGTNETKYDFSIALTDQIDRSILYISNEKNSGFFEQLYQVDKISLNELKNKNLNNYSLIVFDGIPIKKIDQDISQKLVDGYNEDNFGILFVSEAKEIGKIGDNALIESILPIELNPKSLKQDPKVAILMLLDVSSSMMGEKLSIAKVSASQLLINLKPDDLVSLFLFWDQFEKVFNFMPVKEVTSYFSFDKIEATGGTDLAPCLEKGLKDLMKIPSVNKHAIIISDFQTKPASWDSILSYAIENDITISVIQIGTDINPSLAEKIAKTTGGSIYSANSFDVIPTILFEDRKRIARPPFLKQTYTILDSYNDPISQITGMNITTPKENSNVIFKNQYEDPLFSFIKKASKGSAIFLSDSHGIYTRNFFNKNYVRLIFNKFFESQLSNNISKVTVSETSSGFSLIINSTDLYSPTVALFQDGEKLYDGMLTKISQGYFSFSISNINTGLYNLIIKDLGSTMLKIPIFFNGAASANTYSSIILNEFLKYKSRWRKYYSINLWLILFYLSSIATTYFLRIYKK